MIKFSLLLLVLSLFDYVKLNDFDKNLSCNFESEDFCGYTPNEFFERYTGKSPSLSSGPSGDKTDGEFGYYGLCNGRLLRNPGDKCKLSKNISVEIESNFEFWYFMSGRTIGTLELIIDGYEVIWSKTGSQKNEWLLAQVKLRPGEYELEFSANRSELGRTSSDIAIDDISFEGQPLTTQFITVSRTPATPFINISTNFDLLNNFEGWHTEYQNNKWIQVNGNNNQLGFYGPESDWTSINSVNNYTFNRPLERACTIPFKTPFSENEKYYCQKYQQFYYCGLEQLPEISYLNSKSSAKCNLGYFMMITSEKFENSIGIYRSRFYSPVFQLPDGITDFCLSFKYNIYSSSNDGFIVFMENYLDASQKVEIFSVDKTRLKINKWYSVSVQVKDVTYPQIKVFFEPKRGINKEEFASVSVDSILLEHNICDPSTQTTELPETTKISQTEYFQETTSDEITQTITIINTDPIKTTESFTFETKFEQLSTEFTVSMTESSRETSTSTSEECITSPERTEEYSSSQTDIPTFQITDFLTTQEYEASLGTTEQSDTEGASSIASTASSLSSTLKIDSTTKTETIHITTTTIRNLTTSEDPGANKSGLYLAIFIPIGVTLLIFGFLVTGYVFFIKKKNQIKNFMNLPQAVAQPPAPENEPPPIWETRF